MAAQEMSGWWSLTSTTKADSARLCSAGAQRHRGWEKAQRWKKSTGGVGKYFTLNITAVYTEYYGCLQKVLPRAIPETHPRTTQSTASLSCVFSSCVYPF